MTAFSTTALPAPAPACSCASSWHVACAAPTRCCGSRASAVDVPRRCCAHSRLRDARRTRGMHRAVTGGTPTPSAARWCRLNASLDVDGRAGGGRGGGRGVERVSFFPPARPPAAERAPDPKFFRAAHEAGLQGPRGGSRTSTVRGPRPRSGVALRPATAPIVAQIGECGMPVVACCQAAAWLKWPAENVHQNCVSGGGVRVFSYLSTT